MHHSGSGFAQDTLQALAQEGSLVYPTCPGAVGVDGWDAGTVDSVQGEMRGARAEAGAVEHGYCSTCSRHLLPVAVRAQWSLWLDARQHCWVSLERAAAAEGSCCSQQRPGVVVLDTNKMEYERGCSVKMGLGEEVVVEVGEVEDTDRTLADFYQLSSGPPVREQVDAEVEAAGHIDNLLRACCTVDSSQLHQDKRARSVAAEEALRNGHSQLRHSGAGGDTGRHSVANNGHIGVDAGVGAGDAEEARLTDTVYGMGVVEE